MKIIFTSLTSPYVKTGFINLKPDGFRFTEEGRWTMKIVTAMGAGGTTSGNGSVEVAIGSIVGAIKDSDDKDRLLLELEIVIDYFKSSKELSDFFEKVLGGLAPKEYDDDWD